MQERLIEEPFVNEQNNVFGKGFFCSPHVLGQHISTDAKSVLCFLLFFSSQRYCCRSGLRKESFGGLNERLQRKGALKILYLRARRSFLCTYERGDSLAILSTFVLKPGFFPVFDFQARFAARTDRLQMRENGGR